MGQPVPFELDRVTSEPLATGVAVAAASGATTLQVDWNGDFTALPGKLSLSDVTYTYTAKPDDASLVLSTGLVAAAAVGDTVFALTADGKQQRELKAWMRTAGSTEPVPYRVDTALEDKVNVSTPSGTMLLVDEDSMAVVGPLDRATPTDLANAINVPEPATVAGSVPATVPTLLVTGFPTSVQAAVTNQPDVASRVQFYIATSDAAAKDSTTAAGGQSNEFVRSLAALHDGVPLALSTTYYVAAAFVNAQGTGPASAWVPVALNPNLIQQIAAQVATLGAVITGQISVGLGYWNPTEGLVLPNPDGSKTVFPVDGVTPATIAAYLIAKALTVENGMLVYGQSRIYGPTVLANGVSDPTTKAMLGQPSWLSVQMVGGYANDPQNRRGLTQATNPDEWLITGGDVDYFVTINKTTGNTNIWYNEESYGQNGFRPLGGVTRIGANFYSLGQRADDTWWVNVFDSTYNKTGEWQHTDDFLGGTPVIGNDGTNVVIARNALGVTNVRTYSTTGAVVTTGVTGAGKVAVASGFGTSSGLAAVYVGSADFGAARIVLLSQNRSIRTYTVSGDVSTDAWTVAGVANTLGLHWDGTRFHHYDSTGKVWDYNTNRTDTTVDVGYSWMDNDTSSGSITHETRAESTRATVTWKKRTLLTWLGQPAPEAAVTDPTKREKANLLRFYAGTVGGTLRAQGAIGTLGQVQSEAVATIATGTAAAKASNEFNGITGVMGSLSSPTGKLQQNGDDTYALNGVPIPEVAPTPLTSSVAGVTASYTVVNGRVEVTVATTGTPSLASATQTTIVTAANGLPAAYRPAVGEYGYADLANFPGGLVVNTAGAINVRNYSGAARASVAGRVSYPRQ